MPITLGVLMDPIADINPKKDSSFAMLLAAQKRSWDIRYLTPGDLAVKGGQAQACMAAIEVQDQSKDWFRLNSEPKWQSLNLCNILLLRRDPPVSPDFVNDTQVAELAEQEGVLVANAPRALRDCNEKLYALQFPDCIPETVVARRPDLIRDFVQDLGEVVIKPLDGMGGHGIFRVKAGDSNLNVILETLSGEGHHLVMAQRYLPDIVAGDKRILMIDGEPVPFALARIPQGHEFRGNMARGGKAVAQPLSDADRRIAERVGPDLLQRGIRFAGLDVIGDRLTEINVTSPTGIRELDAQCGLDIAGQLLDRLEASLR